MELDIKLSLRSQLKELNQLIFFSVKSPKSCFGILIFRSIPKSIDLKNN